MIGGPNQSHKVIFKDLPFWGKTKSQSIAAGVVKKFSDKFERFFRTSNWKELRSPSPVQPPCFFHGGQSGEGGRDGANHQKPCKHFFDFFSGHDFPPVKNCCNYRTDTSLTRVNSDRAGLRFAYPGEIETPRPCGPPSTPDPLFAREARRTESRSRVDPGGW